MSNKTPRNLNELNDSFVDFMNLFMKENWNHSPQNFIEIISQYIDSVLQNIVCADGRNISVSVVKQYNLDSINNTDKIELMNAVSSYGLTSKIEKIINDKNIFSNNEFYDKEIKKLKTFINKTFQKDTLLKMSPNKKQISEFRGFEPNITKCYQMFFWVINYLLIMICKLLIL